MSYFIRGDLAVIRPRSEWENFGTKCSWFQDDFETGDIVGVISTRNVYDYYFDELDYQVVKVYNVRTGKRFKITSDKLEEITGLNSAEWDYEITY